MQINQQQCSSGASLDQAHILSCLCKLFVGSKMQELSGDKHLPSTQRRQILTELGKKAFVRKAFLNEDARKRDRAAPCSALGTGEGSSCGASKLCHNTALFPQGPLTSLRDGEVAGLLKEDLPCSGTMAQGWAGQPISPNRPSEDHETASQESLCSQTETSPHPTSEEFIGCIKNMWDGSFLLTSVFC